MLLLDLTLAALVTSGCKKGASLFSRMVSLGTVRVRRLARDRAERVQYGRWLGNERVTAEEISEHCGQRVAALCQDRHILAIQDTSELNYQKHAHRTRGLGKVGNGSDAGLFVHCVLAVDADSGDCLGLVGAELWLRTQGKAPNYGDLPIEEKESYRWLKGAMMARDRLCGAAHVTVIADRESDIFVEWARLPNEHLDLLTRACRDRVLAGGGHLFAFLDKLPVAAGYAFDVPPLPGKRRARCAQMEVRFGEVSIKRPQRCRDPQAPEAITLCVVDVRETAQSAGTQTPIHWRLLTTHQIETVAQALQIVAWYSQRWHIEQLFRTVKQQGFDIEASEMETGAALLRLAALALQAAVRCMQMVLARDGSNQPASVAFDQDDIPVLAALQPSLEGKTKKQQNPHPKASLAWATWIIARLGGWNGYKSERPPGPITMLNGLTRFAALAEGWRLAFAQKSI